MSYIKREWTIEHDWRCVYCREINKGRDDKCFNCGKDIDEENCEIIPANMSYENRVKDADVARKLSEGDPDWICNYCGHRERAEKLDCTECGSGKNEKKKNVSSGQDTTKGSLTIDQKTPPRARQDSVILPPVSEDAPEVNLPPQTPAPNFSTTIDEPLPLNDPPEYKKILTVVGGLFGVAGFIWLMFWMFSMHFTTARVQETHWDYGVSLYQRTISNGHDWRGNMHTYAFNISCNRQIRDYHRCNPYSCNPHQVSYSCRCVRSCRDVESCRDVCTSSGRRGSSCREVCTTRQSCSTSCSTCYRTETDTCWNRCPDYDDMCSYQYPEWPQVNQANVHGTDHTPTRPTLRAVGDVSCPNDPEVLYSSGVTQCTREEVTFGVMFNAGEHGQHSVQPASLQEYNRYRVGETWNAEYNHAGQFRVLGRGN